MDRRVQKSNRKRWDMTRKEKVLGNGNWEQRWDLKRKVGLDKGPTINQKGTETGLKLA